MKKNIMDLELRIALFLRWGVILAGLLLLIGWMSFLNFSHNPLAGFQQYKAQSLATSLRNASDEKQYGLLTAYLGLLLLVSLPVIRVLMTGILFLRQKEKTLAAVAFLVLAILILSFSLGIEL